MPFGEMVEQLLARPGACPIHGDERWLVAAPGGRAEGIVLVHPLAPGDVLENVGDGAPGPRWERAPVRVPQVSQVGEQRVLGVAIECLFNEPGESVDGRARAGRVSTPFRRLITGQICLLLPTMVIGRK